MSQGTAPSSRREPTQVDVARRAGVSRALVSMVVRGVGPVREDKRQAVLAAIDELGYRANTAGQLLASKAPRVVGVVTRNLTNPYYGEVIAALEEALAAADYRVLISASHDRAESERAALTSLLGLRVAGLVLIAPIGPAEELRRTAATAPLVSVGRDTSAVGIDSVRVDEAYGGRIATGHLLGLGHRRIAYVTPSGAADWSADQRLLGYREAMTSAGATPVLAGHPNGAGRGRPADLLGDPPATALVAHDDITALAAIRLLARHGVTVPGDVAVVGYDNTALAGLGQVGLTSVDQPREAEGKLAAQMLLERIGGRTSPTHHVLAPTLVIRDSG